jgi:hypothetical protein
LNGFLRQLGTFDSGDRTDGCDARGVHAACNDLGKSVAAWRALNGADLGAVNAALAAAGKPPVAKAAGVQTPAVGSAGGSSR